MLIGASVNGNIPKKYYSFMCAALILVAGFRNTVGGDTIGYMRDWDNSFVSIFNINEIDILYLSQFYRPLIVAMWTVCKTIWSEFYSVQIATSLIVNISAFYIIQKETIYKYEVALLFLLMQYLYFNMEIMREAVAVSAFYFAFRAYDKENWKVYYIAIFIIFFIHDSVFLFFLLPLVHNFIDKQLEIKTYIYVFIVGLICFNPLVLQYLVNLLPGNRGSTFIEGYGAMENATIFGSLRGIIMLFIYCCPLNFFM